MESFVLEQYRTHTDTDIISSDWLNKIIKAYYNGGKFTAELDFIDNYLKHYLTHILPFRKNKGKPITWRQHKNTEQ